MPRCFLWLVTAVTAVTASKGESGHLEDGNALVRRHELEASQPLSQQSLYQAAVDFAGEVHTFKSRHQDRGFGSLESGAAAASRVSRARAAASPAIASSNDPRDADDVARPPSPSRLVSANTMTSPPSAADISAFPQTGNGGNLVPVPPQSDQSDQSNVPTNAPKHKVHKHAVQHRLTMTTLALCMLSSGILGLLVVWRQGKVLLNKPRRREDEPDFQEQVARVLQKRSSQASVRSKASSSSAQVVQQVQQVESHLEAPAATIAPASSAAVAASAMAAPAPEWFDERDAEADAAGGGYNTTHHDPKKYFGSLSDVNPSELALCSDTDFSSGRMNAYVQFSGDYDGMVQQPDGSYFAKCVGPGERWWAAPACRSDLTKCIPTFTSTPGWKVQAMMQWTAAYGFPAAIAISNTFALFQKHVHMFRAFHYWWEPDSTFIDMRPEPVILPRHSPSEWAAGNKKTGGFGARVSKMVSSNLHSKAALVQDFISEVNFELSEVQNLLLLHIQSGATTFFDVACDWIKLHRSRWTRWIPDKTKCSAQFGLFNEKTNQFVNSRADQTNLICRACPSGHFSEELQDGIGSGTHRCVACPAGTSQASGASLACDPCSRGEYQDEEAKSSCKRCEKGKYQGQEGQSQCLQCPPGTTTLGFGSNDLSDCGCNEHTINVAPNETAFQCVPCSEGLYCPFSSTIQSLKDGPALANDQTKDFVPVVEEGYYASLDTPTSVYLCKPSHFCLRGRPGECPGGLRGVPCAKCRDGQTWSEGQCVDCGLSPVAWLSGILVGLAGLVAFYYIGNTEVTAQASPNKVLTMASGLSVNVMQTVSLMGMMTVRWPKVMETTSSGLQFMILDVQSLGLECLLGSGAVARYVSMAAVFPIILTWLLTCSLASGFFPKCAPLRRFQPWTWPGTFNIMGLILQAAFSTVSAVVMQPLMCYSHPNGRKSLLKYPNVKCGSGSVQPTMLAVGLVVGSVFVLAFYVGCIYAAFHMPSWSAKKMDATVSSFRFLISNFRLNRWWFGLLLTARGFCFCLVIVVATDNESAQTSLTTLIIVLYGFSQALAWPWKAPIINIGDVVLSVLLLLLVNKAKTRPQTESANHDWDFTQVFTLVVLLLIAATVATLVLASSCAILISLLGPEESRKRRSTFLTNLSKATQEGAVALALQQLVEDFARSDRDEIEENLANMNHYDFKAVINAIQIISHTVLPAGQLPAGMRTKASLRITTPSNSSTKPKASAASLLPVQEVAQAEQPELEKVEPEEVATVAAHPVENDVNGSDQAHPAGPVESITEYDPSPQGPDGCADSIELAGKVVATEV